VHDGIEFERRGVPAAVIVTEPFIGAAAATAALRGLAHYDVAVVPHPTAGLDDAAVADLARGVVTSI
jgi:hypothetical protein